MTELTTRRSEKKSRSLLLRISQQPRRHSGHSEDTLVERSDSESTLNERPRMSSPGSASDVERRKSYGIGGAGNIRRESDIQAAIDKENMQIANGSERRRSSVWSSNSATGSNGGSILSKLLRRGSKGEVAQAN